MEIVTCISDTFPPEFSWAKCCSKPFLNCAFWHYESAAYISLQPQPRFYLAFSNFNFSPTKSAANNVIKPHKIWCRRREGLMRNVRDLIISLISTTTSRECACDLIWRLSGHELECSLRSGFPPPDSPTVIAHRRPRSIYLRRTVRNLIMHEKWQASEVRSLIMRWRSRRSRLLVFHKLHSCSISITSPHARAPDWYGHSWSTARLSSPPRRICHLINSFRKHRMENAFCAARFSSRNIN